MNVQAHVLEKVSVNKTYRDYWIASLNIPQAIYDFVFEYDNGFAATERVEIAMTLGSQEGIERLTAIRDMLIQDFKEVGNESPFEDVRTYVRKVGQ